MEFRKMVMMTLYVRQQERHRDKEQTFGLCVAASRFIRTAAGGCFILFYGCAEKAMAPHASPLAWKIPWTEEPGRLQSMGSLRVGHD